MVNEIKDLRVKIDGLAKLTKELKPVEYKLYIDDYTDFRMSFKASKEIKKSVDSLYLAKAWLGKILGELGTENPYKGGYRTVEDIEPTADVNNEVPFGDEIGKTPFREKSHIEKVDWLRTEIQKIIDETEDFSQEVPIIELEQGFVYKYLCEAKMWLGFELGRYREVHKTEEMR